MIGLTDPDVVGQAWLTWLSDRLLASTIALGVVVLALATLRVARRGRGHGSAHLPSYLLLLPLLVLAVPVERAFPAPTTIELPLVASSIHPAPTSTANTPASRPTFGPTATTQTQTPATGDRQPAPTPSTLPWRTLVAAAWFAILTGLAVRLFYRQRAALAALERQSRDPNAELVARFDLLVRESGVRRAVTLRLVDDIESPLTSGIHRPIVWFPSNTATTMSPTEVHFALRHELAHVRRHDVAIGAGIEALRCAFWFFPGFWLAAALHARWREYACDEAALSRSNVDRTALADSLLTLIERACEAPAPALPHAHLLSEKTFMKTRLLRILDPRFRARPGLSIAAGPMLALTVLGTVTLAQSRLPETPPGTTAPTVIKNPGAPQRRDVDVALTQGSRWLLQNQQENGGWLVGPDPAGKNVRDHNSTCVTAMAILALLPGLRTEPLPIAKAVQRAAALLETQQQDNGRIGPDDPLAAHYAHAFALRALAAVQREWPTDARLQRIELGTKYCYRAQNPYMGWRYYMCDGDNDSKITAMMLLALRDAATVGVDLKPTNVTWGLDLLNQLTNPENGRVGFVRRGGPMSRFVSKKADFPGNLSEEPTALALLARIAHDDSRESWAKNANQRGLQLIGELPPDWNTEKGSIDLAYWHFAAEALALAASADTPQIEPVVLERWRAALRNALVPHRLATDNTAHWPAIDAWAHPGMEVYTTSSAMLALQALH